MTPFFTRCQYLYLPNKRKYSESFRFNDFILFIDAILRMIKKQLYVEFSILNKTITIEENICFTRYVEIVTRCQTVRSTV